MRYRATWAIGIVGAAVLLILAACAPNTPAAGTPRYRSTDLAPGDSMTVDDATEDVTIDIKSERGIGQAEIQRFGPAPKSLTINFHLKALEELQFGWDEVIVLAHVSSSDGTVWEELRLNGGQPAPIDSTSPYWTPIRIEAQNPKIPLADGFFAVTAPPAFLQAEPQRFSLKWIDFYR